MSNKKTRNWVARADIMKKGGVHDKSNKAKRQKDKQAFKRKIRAEQFGSFWFCKQISDSFKCTDNISSLSETTA